MIFAFGLTKVSRSQESADLGAFLIGIVGIGALLLAVFRSDCSEYRATCQRSLASGNASLSEQIHGLLTAIIFPLGSIAPAITGYRLARIRKFSIATTLVALLLMTFYVSELAGDWNGLLQRAFASTPLIWIGAISAYLRLCE